MQCNVPAPGLPGSTGLTVSLVPYHPALELQFAPAQSLSACCLPLQDDDLVHTCSWSWPAPSSAALAASASTCGGVPQDGGVRASRRQLLGQSQVSWLLLALASEPSALPICCLHLAAQATNVAASKRPRKQLCTEPQAFGHSFPIQTMGGAMAIVAYSSRVNLLESPTHVAAPLAFRPTSSFGNLPRAAQVAAETAEDLAGT
ncbi:hypothetical protein PHYPSEUDO_012291 [Phytophthora pseudosyringae]|uniref:Uncharacterized protein n=1 Tax=Phytophthora pseudosyringae TaxID=221518 RepID=A0A8T1W533_9STRA|nr:hypothetical protein PHYPSEUDO_012291 [Phytophthora pseudosyringae]